MPHRTSLTIGTLLILTAFGCSTVDTELPPIEAQPDAAAPAEGPDAAPEPTGPSGTFSLLTYNVAGLPQGISSGDPIKNSPLISPLLNQYDVALVQEDFSYHADIAGSAEHAYQSDPGPVASGRTMNDGLNRFSASSFGDFERHMWEDCNGIINDKNDCLASKGFSVATHVLAPGAEVDVYNLHMDAGKGEKDVDTRWQQALQLADVIETRSAGRAVLIAGDTNMKPVIDEENFVSFLEMVQLTDACRNLSCPEPTRIDRVLYLSSETVELTAANWRVDESFVDDAGEPLSDHDPVGIDIQWTYHQAQ